MIPIICTSAAILVIKNHTGSNLVITVITCVFCLNFVFDEFSHAKMFHRPIVRYRLLRASDMWYLKIWLCQTT